MLWYEGGKSYSRRPGSKYRLCVTCHPVHMYVSGQCCDRAKGAICRPLCRILQKLLVKSLWKVQEVALQLLGCLKTPTYLWCTWPLGLVKLLLLRKVLQM